MTYPLRTVSMVFLALAGCGVEAPSPELVASNKAAALAETIWLQHQLASYADLFPGAAQQLRYAYALPVDDLTASWPPGLGTLPLATADGAGQIQINEVGPDTSKLPPDVRQRFADQGARMVVIEDADLMTKAGEVDHAFGVIFLVNDPAAKKSFAVFGLAETLAGLDAYRDLVPNAGDGGDSLLCSSLDSELEAPNDGGDAPSAAEPPKYDVCEPKCSAVPQDPSAKKADHKCVDDAWDTYSKRYRRERQIADNEIESCKAEKAIARWEAWQDQVADLHGLSEIVDQGLSFGAKAAQKLAVKYMAADAREKECIKLKTRNFNIIHQGLIDDRDKALKACCTLACDKPAPAPIAHCECPLSVGAGEFVARNDCAVAAEKQVCTAGTCAVDPNKVGPDGNYLPYRIDECRWIP